MDKVAFKAKLIELIEKTTSEVADIKAASSPISPDNAIGRVSRMDAINNKGVNDAALRNLTQKLSGLKEALQNIDDPKFGQCARCGCDIPEGRILLVPQSKFCVKCAR